MPTVKPPRDDVPSWLSPVAIARVNACSERLERVVLHALPGREEVDDQQHQGHAPDHQSERGVTSVHPGGADERRQRHRHRVAQRQQSLVLRDQACAPMITMPSTMKRASHSAMSLRCAEERDDERRHRDEREREHRHVELEQSPRDLVEAERAADVDAGRVDRLRRRLGQSASRTARRRSAR